MNRTIAADLALAFAASLGILSGGAVRADPAPFDLTGPNLRITVTRGGVTLPIGTVPQLAPGDAVKVAADLPANQTAHYVLVTAFLRDPTNPPPEAWFEKSELWKHGKSAIKPIELTVPDGAQHLAVFFAPEAGGDYRTLRSAVEARPGAFVRAAQDLEQASLDRARYDAYLAAIRQVAASDQATSGLDTLAHVAPVLAESLHIKINQDCLQRQPEFQAACLLDSHQTAVLGNDNTAGNSAMTGAATDLALSLSATPAGGLGYYSPYIDAIRDIVGIFGAMHTAKYQYIPALGVAHADRLELVLNTPPSFANPKSVLMAALPSIKAAHPPVLRLATGGAPACLGTTRPLLPLVASPLVYATGYAHDVRLSLALPGGGKTELALMPDATRGGLAIAPLAAPLPVAAGQAAGQISATIHGMWGFDPFVGPQVALPTAGDWQWKSDGAGKSDGALVLTGAASACVAGVTATRAAAPAATLTWKVTGPHDIAVIIPAADGRTEPWTIRVAGPQGTTPATVVVAPPTKPPPPPARIAAHSSEPQVADKTGAIAISPGNADQIPADTRLNFTVTTTTTGERFNGHDSIEVAAATDDAPARLTTGNGLTLVGPTTLVATMLPVQTLGMSAFGPLRARLVRNGVTGDWLSLGTLVRMPRLKHLTCPADVAAMCTLSGEGLYLLASVSASPDFDNAISVAEGYPGFTLSVPHPAKGVLYVRLHDSPEVVNQVQFPPNSGQK